MLVVLYHGDPGDPMQQQIRIARASSLEDARRSHPDAIMVEAYVRPQIQQEVDLRKLRRGMPAFCAQ